MRQFLIIKGWTIEKVRERGKEERKANQVGAKEVTKGFGKGRVEPPTEINIEEHAEPQPQKELEPKRKNRQQYFYKMMKH